MRKDDEEDEEGDGCASFERIGSLRVSLSPFNAADSVAAAFLPTLWACTGFNTGEGR
jgi:hypothetical protein